MRDILFRGKRTDNGEWVYEDLWYNPYGKRIGWVVSPMNDQGTTDGNEVDPKTVGQFIGLYDKNSNKIFEGDIIRTKKYGKVVGHVNVNDYDTFQVVYEPAVFRLVNPTRGFNLVGQSIDLEVIGNIYDNPELLKGGVKND